MTDPVGSTDISPGGASTPLLLLARPQRKWRKKKSAKKKKEKKAGKTKSILKELTWSLCHCLLLWIHCCGGNDGLSSHTSVDYPDYPAGLNVSLWRSTASTASIHFLDSSVSGPYPLQEAHVLKLGAGVRQALQSVGEIVVCWKVEGICVKNIVDHGQEGLVVLHLQQTNPNTTDESIYWREL